MEIRIENCNNLEDYLRMCHVDTIDKLSDDQLMDWARSGKMGLKTKISVDIVENGLFGEIPDKKKAIMMLKQALHENKEFVCVYIENESCEGLHGADDSNIEYFDMSLRDKR